MKKVAIILSGCGVYDGTEVNEAVLTLLHIAKAGAQYQCFAPDIMQMHTIDHLTGEELADKRNVLVEAARIARGEIKPITELAATDYDALILPGGFGAAKNLSNFAVKGIDAHIEPSVLRACQAFVDANKPAGYMCIAPAMIPLIYPSNAKVTIGCDQDTADAINTLGASHQKCAVDEIIIDQQNKLVTTPAYMMAESILDADAGIEKLVSKVLEMC